MSIEDDNPFLFIPSKGKVTSIKVSRKRITKITMITALFMISEVIVLISLNSGFSDNKKINPTQIMKDPI